MYHKNEEVIRREIAGEVILVPVTGNLADLNRLYVLNPVADLAWSAFDSVTDQPEITSRIVAAFEVEQQVAEADLEALCQSLCELDLIKVV